MGQQQLLLIVICVFVVGITAAVGIMMFTDSAQSSNRDAVSNDLAILASAAQQYYRRPGELGGGSSSFTGLTLKHLSPSASTSVLVNDNGSYMFSGTPGGIGPVVIQGQGVELGRDGANKLMLVMQVWPDSAKIDPQASGSN